MNLRLELFKPLENPLSCGANSIDIYKELCDNWRDEDVEFGFFSTDEMMILFGHYYLD